MEAEPEPEAPPALVGLVCLKVGGKLRVRITSAGYYNDANCSFPRALRAEGMRYAVRPDCIKLVQSGATKAFYSVNKHGVTPLDPTTAHIGNVYEDASSEECCVCLCDAKDTVFNCGHFYTCRPCSMRLSNCPICRTPIALRIAKENVQ
jgi:hypothetical protein